MKKKIFLKVLLFSIFAALVMVCNVSAFEDMDTDLIEPAADTEFVVLRNNQSKTVTADLTSAPGSGITFVSLFGNGNFSMSLSRNTTTGEIAYLAFYGFGVPTYGINVGITPVTLRLNSSISDSNYKAIGVIFHGILFSLEDPPYEYNLSLSF